MGLVPFHRRRGKRRKSTVTGKMGTASYGQKISDGKYREGTEIE